MGSAETSTHYPQCHWLFKKYQAPGSKVKASLPESYAKHFEMMMADFPFSTEENRRKFTSLPRNQKLFIEQAYQQARMAMSKEDSAEALRNLKTVLDVVPEYRLATKIRDEIQARQPASQK